MPTFRSYDVPGRDPFDNSPGSSDSDDSNDPEVILDTTNYRGEGVVVLEYFEDGVKKTIGMKTEYLYSWETYASEGSGLYIVELIYSVNGDVADSYTNLLLEQDNFLFYGSTGNLEEYIWKYSDVIYGVSTNDNIYGYDGDDRLYGYGGDDFLNGGRGNDTLYGGSGDDHLDGWYGKDIIYGGSGYDHAHYVGKQFDYVLSRHPVTNVITTTYETGFDKGTVHSDVEEIHFGDGVVIIADTITYKGSFSNVKSGAVSPIYRFYNNRDKAYFYTASGDEKDYVITNSGNDRADSIEWPYVYQGSTFEAAHSYLSSDALVPLYRFYNTDTGHHFFTASQDEADMIKGKAASGEWPFNYEGTAFNVYSSDPNPGSSGEELAIHRFYSPSLNRHFFTGDLTEVENMKLTGIWDYEGVGFFGEILG